MATTSVAENFYSCGPQICQSGAKLRPSYEKDSAFWPKAHIDPSIKFEELGFLKRPGIDRSSHLIELGKQLFDDPILSQSGQFSCSSCHIKELRFADGMKTPFGHNRQRGTRNTPSLLDKGEQPNFMWDGSGLTMAHQALMPIANPIEMASDPEKVEARLNANPGYREGFARVFDTQNITLGQTSEALAAFTATLHRTSDFDKFMQGHHRRLNDQQILGLHLFRTTARCANCHMGQD